MKLFALIGWAILFGLVAGGLLDVATFLVARYGPAADSWSFRGNGALVVPFGLGPAILAGAWVAIVLHYRRNPRWKELGLAAGVVGTSFLLVSVLALVVFNSAGMAVSNAMFYLILGWMVVAPVLAGFLPAPPKQTHRGQLGGHVLAGVFFAVALLVGFFASELVVSPGS